MEGEVNDQDEYKKIANSIPKKLELFLTQKGQEGRLENLKEYNFLTNGRLFKKKIMEDLFSRKLTPLL